MCVLSVAVECVHVDTVLFVLLFHTLTHRCASIVSVKTVSCYCNWSQVTLNTETSSTDTGMQILNKLKVLTFSTFLSGFMKELHNSLCVIISPDMVSSDC